MAISVALNGKQYRVMFKYGWFHTNINYPLRVARQMVRDLMAASVVNIKEPVSGDLVFHDDKSNHIEDKAKYVWRMCSVFINEVTETVVNGEVVTTNTIVAGPYTSVCVPGDRFSYEEARNHALATLKDSALNIYDHARINNKDLPQEFFVIMAGYTAYNRRPRKRK